MKKTNRRIHRGSVMQMTSMKSIVRSTLAISVLFGVAMPAVADDECARIGSPDQNISDLGSSSDENKQFVLALLNDLSDYNVMCIIDDKTLPLWSSVDHPEIYAKSLVNSEGNPLDEAGKALKIIQVSRDIIGQLQTLYGSTPYTNYFALNEDLRESYVRDLRSSLSAIEENRINQDDTLRNSAWDLAIRHSDPSITIGRGYVRVYDLYSGLLETNCPADGELARCREAYQAVLLSLQLSRTMQAVTLRINSIDLDKVVGEMRLLRDRWMYFVNDARTLYYWELVTAVGDLKDENPGLEEGFYPAPTSQTFWLHPTASYEYLDDASSSNDTQAAMTMEWYGKNWWHWKDDTSSEAGIAYGFSLISTYADRDGFDDWGHGVMMHINHKYSFGVTYRDNGDVGFTINFNLAKFFDQWNDGKLSEILPEDWLQ